jgi:hypothetical protein
VDDNRRLDFELQLAELRDTTQVAAATTSMLREDGLTGLVIEQPTIVNLPLNGRSYTQLALLSPGVAANPGARMRSDGANINGNRALQNNFLIDGLDNCNYLFAAAGGTGRPMCVSLQLARLTNARVAELREMTKRIEGDVCGCDWPKAIARRVVYLVDWTGIRLPP